MNKKQLRTMHSSPGFIAAQDQSGYSVEKANELLGENHGLIASFPRALVESLRYQQTDTEFDGALKTAVDSIYEASVK